MLLTHHAGEHRVGDGSLFQRRLPAFSGQYVPEEMGQNGWIVQTRMVEGQQQTQLPNLALSHPQ